MSERPLRIFAQKEFTEKQIQAVKNRKDKTPEQKARFVMEMRAYNMRSARGDFDTY